MPGFSGGSAYAMARDIGEGYFAVTERALRALSSGELTQLAHEIDRHLRELRAAPSPKDETVAIQTRNRRIQRLGGALAMLRAVQQRSRS